MDATFLARIKDDFPELKFVSGARFSFRPPRTVVLNKSECRALDVSGNSGNPNADKLLLLHEIGHALTKRYDFNTEIERLKIEVLAWEKAKELAPVYGVDIDEDLIQGELDTYRDFLHQKSRCPSCGLTRFQTPDKLWHCPNCEM